MSDVNSLSCTNFPIVDGIVLVAYFVKIENEKMVDSIVVIR